MKNEKLKIKIRVHPPPPRGPRIHISSQPTYPQIVTVKLHVANR